MSALARAPLLSRSLAAHVGSAGHRAEGRHASRGCRAPGRAAPGPGAGRSCAGFTADVAVVDLRVRFVNAHVCARSFVCGPGHGRAQSPQRAEDHTRAAAVAGSGACAMGRCMSAPQQPAARPQCRCWHTSRPAQPNVSQVRGGGQRGGQSLTHPAAVRPTPCPKSPAGVRVQGAWGRLAKPPRLGAAHARERARHGRARRGAGVGRGGAVTTADAPATATVAPMLRPATRTMEHASAARSSSICAAGRAAGCARCAMMSLRRVETRARRRSKHFDWGARPMTPCKAWVCLENLQQICLAQALRQRGTERVDDTTRAETNAGGRSTRAYACMHARLCAA